MIRYSLRLLAPLALLVLAACFAADEGDGARSGAAGASDSAAAPPLAGKLAGGGSYVLPRRSTTPTVVLFFRGSFCPICLARMRSLAGYASAYRAAGVRVVAVTLDGPDIAQGTARDLALPYPLLSVEPATFLRWGVLKPGQAQPRPGDFVVDGTGRIRYARVGDDEADRPGDTALLGIIDSLRSAGALARR